MDDKPKTDILAFDRSVIENMVARCAALEAENAALRAQLTDADYDATLLEQRRSELDNEAESLRAQLAESTTLRNRLLSELEHTNAVDIGMLEAENAALLRERNEYRAANFNMVEDIRALRAQLAAEQAAITWQPVEDGRITWTEDDKMYTLETIGEMLALFGTDDFGEPAYSTANLPADVRLCRKI
jgi:chromosome segregation ATPase